MHRQGWPLEVATGALDTTADKLQNWIEQTERGRDKLLENLQSSMP
jgi:hypothetical protein